MATPDVPSSPGSPRPTLSSSVSLSDFRSEKGVEAIVSCYNETEGVVLHSLLALVDFGGIEEDVALHSPGPGFTLGFKKGNYLHIKKEYNDDWMLGRVVGHECSIGFLPCRRLLASVVKKRDKLTCSLEEINVYNVAPILRPILILGPSLKKYEMTRLLQKALMSHITKQFGNRMVVIKPESSIETLSAKEASVLKKRIFSEGRKDRMVLLDCDASFPYQLSGLGLHAIVVYIQINQKKILVKLVKEHCKDSAQREEQLQAAYRLYDLPPSQFSLILTDTNLQDASQNLELFIESYWACTHPPLSVTLQCDYSNSS